MDCLNRDLCVFLITLLIFCLNRRLPRIARISRILGRGCCDGRDSHEKAQHISPVPKSTVQVIVDAPPVDPLIFTVMRKIIPLKQIETAKG